MLSLPPRDGRDAFAFIETLDRLSDAAAVSDALQVMLARFGFEAFLLSELPANGQKFEEAVLTMRLPAEWFQIYTKEEYFRVDPQPSQAIGQADRVARSPLRFGAPAARRRTDAAAAGFRLLQRIRRPHS